MIHVGLTGGIGSGKSTVARVFEMLAVPVFYADQIAKEAYNDPMIRHQMIAYFGEGIYNHTAIHKQKLAAEIFNDEEKRQFVESIIHPFVARQYSSFKEKHKYAPYIIREAAILIESGAYKDCDQIIVVTAPEEDRIKRVMRRDNCSKDEVIARLSKQLNDEQRRKFATQVWANDNLFPMLETILRFDNFIRA